ncbi:hypothetical protein LPB72_04835 [Hydrogenophaga crassostreae]|uniref:Uncharacterized protein n=1 Tax=Hydrogenophaga crassostreae TaxID=1763535 RepID=A0A162W1T5_9BURK|nr:hypothetical protein [Hydrogenophaga crassostreae]AOW14719.1 hypothetical protein LPB072_19715 [Hydrogenophaga crassostreae]OAD43184.1 hypothetical protein LPB72_04835 [Hydrogenophaga crassostreae]
MLDLCELLGVAKPGSEAGYIFEQGSRLAGQAHQQTKALPNSPHGALITAQLGGNPALQAVANRIAEAAARLNALREAWLNPPEWTVRVPEVVPLGLERSPTPTAWRPSKA